MRMIGSSVRRFTTSAIRMAARLQGTLNGPLRWPRVTTRRLMVLVAIVALEIWAVKEVPTLVDRSRGHQHHAYTLSVHAQEYRDRQRKQLARARTLQARLDQWRQNEGVSDELTGQYLAVPWEDATVDARFFGEMADYYSALEPKYRRAAWFPWATVPRDPPPPSDPESLRRINAAVGGVREAIEGGVAVAFAPRGTALAVACRDHAIRLLEPPSRKAVATFPLPDGSVLSMAFSPDGATLVAVGASREGRCVAWRWDVPTHRPLPAWSCIDPVSDRPDSPIYLGAVAYSPSGGTIAVGGGGAEPEVKTTVGMPFASVSKPLPPIHIVRVLGSPTGALGWASRGKGDWISSLAFSPDGETLAVAKGPVLLLDARSGDRKRTMKPEAGHVLAVAFSPDGRTLAGAGSHSVGMGGFGGDGRITLWDVATGEIVRTLNGPTGRAQKVAFSPDGRTLAVGGAGPETEGRDTWTGTRRSKKASEVQLWDVARGARIWAFEGESDSAFSLAFSADGKLLAFCDQDYVYLLDSRTGSLKQIVMKTVVRTRTRDPLKKHGPGGTGR